MTALFLILGDAFWPSTTIEVETTGNHVMKVLAPSQPGVFKVFFQSYGVGGQTGPLVSQTIEVTCSASVSNWCEGEKRWIPLSGRCVRTYRPCGIDKRVGVPETDPCFIYPCNAATKSCGRVPVGGAACGECFIPPCIPSCVNKTCGDDGCGGSCGSCSIAGQVCNTTSFSCVPCSPQVGGNGDCGVFFFFVCFPLIVSTKSAPEKSAETMLASALAAIVHRHKHALLTKRVAFRRALLLAPAHRRIHCLESICPSVLPSSIRTTRTASRTSFLSSWSFFKKRMVFSNRYFKLNNSDAYTTEPVKNITSASDWGTVDEFTVPKSGIRSRIFLNTDGCVVLLLWVVFECFLLSDFASQISRLDAIARKWTGHSRYRLQVCDSSWYSCTRLARNQEMGRT